MNYRQALLSIAANTCCKPCQEAALVAREALDSAPPLELPDGFIDRVKLLVREARMSGGVAGRDDYLCEALDALEPMLEAIDDPDWQAGARGEFRLPQGLNDGQT